MKGWVNKTSLKGARPLTYPVVRELIEGTGGHREIAHETALEEIANAPGGRPDYALTLRDHTIMIFHGHGGWITLDPGIWRTLTTRKRYLDFLPDGWLVYTKDTIWYVSHPDLPSDSIFMNRMKIRYGKSPAVCYHYCFPVIHNANKPPDMEYILRGKKVLKQYIKGYLKAIEHNNLSTTKILREFDAFEPPYYRTIRWWINNNIYRLELLQFLIQEYKVDAQGPGQLMDLLDEGGHLQHGEIRHFVTFASYQLHRHLPMLFGYAPFRRSA